MFNTTVKLGLLPNNGRTKHKDLDLKKKNKTKTKIRFISGCFLSPKELIFFYEQAGFFLLFTPQVIMRKQQAVFTCKYMIFKDKTY